MGASVIVADKVTKVFEGGRRDQVVALKDLSLEVADGEFVCLVGGSGCGKTTFLNLVAGFLSPTEGVIYLRGRRVAGIEPRAGMIFQSYALLPWKTVAGNVEFGPKMKRLHAPSAAPSPSASSGWWASPASSTSIRASCRAGCSSA